MRASSAPLGSRSVLSELMDAHRGGADERGDVWRNAAALQRLQVTTERGPVDVVGVVALLLAQLVLHRLVERPARLTLAEDLQRHALLDVAHPASVDDQRLGGPGQHVDEAGSDGLAGGVDLRGRARRGEIAERHDRGRRGSPTSARRPGPHCRRRPRRCGSGCRSVHRRRAAAAPAHNRPALREAALHENAGSGTFAPEPIPCRCAFGSEPDLSDQAHAARDAATAPERASRMRSMRRSGSAAPHSS